VFDLGPQCFLGLCVDRRGIRFGFAGARLFAFGPGGPVFGVLGPEFGLGLRSLGFGNFGLFPGFLGRLLGLLSFDAS